MNKPPLISVILPTYNRLQFLPQTVESILNQTLADFELIIINDGSTDKTEEWVKKQNDKRIRYIGYPKNRSVSHARNMGLDAARGEFIAFADSDDLNDKTRFSEQVACLTSDEEIAVCGTDIQFFGLKTNTRTYRQRLLPFRVKALFEIPFHFPACMVRRSFIEKEKIRFRPEIRSADDYYFLMKIVAKGKAKVIPKTLYHYRWHEASISIGKKVEQEKNELAINRLAFQEILQLDLRDIEIKLIHRFIRYRCLPEEATAIRNLVEKLKNFTRKTHRLNDIEKQSLIDLLTQKRLAYEKKKIQLLYSLVKQGIRYSCFTLASLPKAIYRKSF